MTKRPYFSLLTNSGTADSPDWSIQFGDYDRATVEGERAEMRSAAFDPVPFSRSKIIKTAADQASILAAVAKLNAGHWVPLRATRNAPSVRGWIANKRPADPAPADPVLALERKGGCGAARLDTSADQPSPRPSRFQVYQLTAPSHWASYLIIGDDSGMALEERRACDAWLNREGLGFPVSCDDSGFCHWHDAREESPFSADCQTYTFLVDCRADQASAIESLERQGGVGAARADQPLASAAPFSRICGDGWRVTISLAA